MPLEHFYHHIEGWFDFAPFYKRMVEEAPQEAHFVEIGAWLGRSTAFLAVEIVNSGKEITLDVVDTWEGSPDQPWMIEEAHKVDLFGTFCRYMEWGKVDKIVRPMQYKSTEAAVMFTEKSMDFVFIDGCHCYSEISADIEAWLPKVKPGGVLAGDDFDTASDPGVCIAVSELVSDYKTDGRIWWKRMEK